jgi:drug/metabolite transporter (DMT)-like permease
MYRMTNANKKWLYFIVLSLIWGSSFILIKKSLIGLSPYQVGGLRVVFATVFLLGIGIHRVKEIKKADWKWIGLSGFFDSFFPPFLFAIAQTEIDSAVASILNSLTPLYTIVLGILFFSVLIGRKQLLGVCIGLIGTVILILTGSKFNPDQNYWYSVLIVLSTIGYAFNIHIIKKHLSHINAISVAVGSFLVVVIPSFAILYFSGFFETVFSSEKMQKALLYVLVLSIFGTAAAKVLFNKLVGIVSPVFAASVTYTMPLIAVFWGLWDGEVLNFYQLLGGATILLGVYLTNRTYTSKKAPQ